MLMLIQGPNQNPLIFCFVFFAYGEVEIVGLSFEKLSTLLEGKVTIGGITFIDALCVTGPDLMLSLYK